MCVRLRPILGPCKHVPNSTNQGFCNWGDLTTFHFLYYRNIGDKIMARLFWKFLVGRFQRQLSLWKIDGETLLCCHGLCV